MVGEPGLVARDPLLLARDLQGAFGRRAIIEQAKGILMAQNGIDADAAFALLKSHSQQTGRKLNDVAQALTQTHQLLGPHRQDNQVSIERGR